MFIGNEELLSSEFKSIFNNNSAYAFALVTFDGRIKYINSELPAILGMPKNSFLNQTVHYVVTEFVHPDDINMTIQALNEVMNGQGINGFENRYRVQDGSYIWLSWILIPFVDEKVYYAIAHEITEQRGLKERLEKSVSKIETILCNITDSIYAINKQWEFIYVNKSAARVFSKITGQNVLGKRMGDILPDNDGLYFRKFSEAIHTQKPVHFETLSVLDDGWISVNVYPSSEGISVYVKDISEQKKFEKSLEDERERLYAVLNGLPGLVYLRTREGNVIFANQNFKKIYGEPDNKKCHYILFNKDERCSDCHTPSTSETELPKQWQCVSKDIIFEVFQHPFKDYDGTQLFLMQLLDITQAKLQEEEITRLDRLNLVGQLAASLAHEVRNPMTTVRGFLQILKSKDNLPENGEYYDLMISELDRANSIITEFLSVAKIKTELCTDVKLNNLVNSLYPLILADALNQDKQFILIAEEVDELTMNEREIRQLILNLTRNGFEAMASRGILKIMTYMEENSVVLAVQDQGIGISADSIEKLGTPFLTTKKGGTGLGLATCYSIADRHNAKIDVESSVSGTTFFVRFNK